MKGEDKAKAGSFIFVDILMRNNQTVSSCHSGLQKKANSIGNWGKVYLLASYV
jgi:hypothetical protein